MVGKIDMILPNYVASITGDISIINNIEIKTSQDDIDNIIRSIREWDNIYKSNSIIDSTSSIVLYDKDNNVIDKFLFEGKYPLDFSNLLEIVGEIYARR